VQGLDPCTQIWPTVVFPLAMPSTAHVTAGFEEFVTVAVNVARWFSGTLAEFGVTVTITLLTIVTLAVADCGGLV
jgi:hypothetical protein